MRVNTVSYTKFTALPDGVHFIFDSPKIVRLNAALIGVGSMLVGLPILRLAAFGEVLYSPHRQGYLSLRIFHGIHPKIHNSGFCLYGGAFDFFNI